MKHAVSIACALSLFACTENDEQIELRIQESTDAISIVGLDRNGNQVARVQFHHGTVVMADDDGRVVDGLQIDATVYGLDWHHDSEGRGIRHLRLMPMAELQRLNDFMVDPRVQAVAARWQIDFVAPAKRTLPVNDVPEEKAFRGCSHSAGPSCGEYSATGASCGEYDVNVDYYNCVYAVQELRCCAGSGTRTYRICGAGWQNPCGPEGPNGCAVCGSGSYGSSCQVITAGSAFSDCYPDGNHGIWTDSLYFSN